MDDCLNHINSDRDSFTKYRSLLVQLTIDWLINFLTSMKYTFAMM